LKPNTAPLLITGASGLLGANLVLELADRGHAVIALHGQHPISARDARSIGCDLTDSSSSVPLLVAAAPSVVIHCAAATNVDWCESHPRECMEINSTASGQLAAAARSVGAKFVYISSDAVFDGVSGGYAESDPVAPCNIYAQSKVAGENAVLRESPDSLILRVNIYGWNLQPKFSLAEWILSRLEGANPVPGFTDTTFAPVLVNDMTESILQLVNLGCSGIYHLASADSCSKYHFARQIASVFGLEESLVRQTRIDTSPLKAVRPRNTWLRGDKFAATVGQAAPTVRTRLERFRVLRENGFADRLKAASAETRIVEGCNASN
jgi:dTDP-4-dehydrorhamnose reductase